MNRNNANFAALAEWRQGTAQGLSHFIYFLADCNEAVGGDPPEAFGASIFFHGQIYHGANFAAGEIAGDLKPRINFSLEEPDFDNMAAEDEPLTDRMMIFAQETGRCMAALVGLIDPQGIILASDPPIGNLQFIAQVNTTIDQLLVPIDRQGIMARLSALKQQAVALGAGLAILDKLDDQMACAQANQ